MRMGAANPADAELVSPDAGGCPRLRTLRIGEAADEKGFKRPRMVAGERIREASGGGQVRPVALGRSTESWSNKNSQ
jgi:hypothetical protein